jgi:hypothetical protein
MTSPLLLRLGTDEFNDDIGFVLPPVAMRRKLRRSPAVSDVNTALRYFQITIAEVRDFVSSLLMDFRPGEVFQHDIALAALAVAMEDWPNPFAEEYLLDLARVCRSEFRSSFRVARECLKARYEFPRTQVKTSRYPQRTATEKPVPRTLRVMCFAQRSESVTLVRWVRYLEVFHAST